uniref:Extended synaptotagmin-2 n=1 Tax=Strongyloides venezuelensis TaxID=75913 RepID=A0A0K0F792_STRVS
MLTTQELTISSCISISLMIICWLVGYLNYSFLWIIFAIIGHIVKTITTKNREEKRTALQILASQEREAILAQLDLKQNDLPAWVQFPDTERVLWLNKVIQQLWPYIGEYSKKFLVEIIEPQVRAQMPSPFKSFKFIKIDMGDLSCRVGGLKVYTKNVGRDKIIVDMDVSYAGDADFTVNVCGFNGGMNQVVLTGKVRCICQPLLPFPPMIGGISASFIDLPKFDFNLTGMGEFGNLPGLTNAIRTVVNQQLRDMCVLPNKIFVPLAPEVDMTTLYFPEPDGVVLIKVMEARNLENRDISIIIKDKSDPYVEIKIGAAYFRTKTIDNNLNPKWNEEFEAIVEQASLQSVRFEVFDEDKTGSDEELGRLTVATEKIQNQKSIDKWYYLEGCKHGDIHVAFEWLALRSDPLYLTKPIYLSNSKLYSQGINDLRKSEPRCLVMVFVDNVNDLPYPKAHLEPSPFIKIQLDNQVQTTPIKLNTINPLYQSKFSFFINGPHDKSLLFTAIDDGTKRTLGELSIPLNNVIREPNMEYFQQTFYLSHGVTQSAIVLTIRVRALEPSSVTGNNGLNSKNKGEFYGSGQHIERADKNEFGKILVENNQKATTTILNSDKVETLQRENGEIIFADPVISIETENSKNSNNLSPTKSLKSPGSITSMISDTGSTVSRRKGILSKLTTKKHDLAKGSLNTSFIERGDPQLAISLRFDKRKFSLQLEIVGAKDLIPVEKNGHIKSYVNVKLFEIGKEGPVSKQSTNAIEDTYNPEYNGLFQFSIVPEHLKNYVFRFEVKDSTNYGIFKKPPLLGWIDYKLNDFRIDEELTSYWMVLKRDGDLR